MGLTGKLRRVRHTTPSYGALVRTLCGGPGGLPLGCIWELPDRRIVVDIAGEDVSITSLPNEAAVFIPAHIIDDITRAMRDRAAIILADKRGETEAP